MRGSFLAPSQGQRVCTWKNMASILESQSCSESCSTDSFDSWVKSHGGDDDFLKILHSFGFRSKLSLGE